MHLRMMHTLHEEDHMHEKHGHDLSRVSTLFSKYFR